MIGPFIGVMVGLALLGPVAVGMPADILGLGAKGFLRVLTLGIVAWGVVFATGLVVLT